MNKRNISNPFYLNSKSLNCFRVVLALVLLGYFLVVFRDCYWWYSSSGLIPAEIMITNFAWFIEYFSGDFTCRIVAISGILLSTCLIFSGKRILFLLTWLVLLIVILRSTYIVDNGVKVLHLLLLWSCFIDFEECRTKKEFNLYSFGSFALIFQIFMIYFFAFLGKDTDYWRWGNDTLSMVLNGSRGNLLAVKIAALKLDLSPFTRFLVYGEGVLALCLVSPFYVAICRYVAILIIIILHLSILLTLSIGVFPISCLLLFIPLIPTEFWKRFSTTQLAYIFGLGRQSKVSIVFRPIKLNLPNILGVTLISLCLFFCLNNKFGLISRKPFLIAKVYSLGDFFGFFQSWRMFNKPDRGVSWYAFNGVLKSGKQVDMVSWIDRNDIVSFPTQDRTELRQILSQNRSYVSMKWYRYFRKYTVSDKYATSLKAAALKSVCNRWNDGSREDLLTEVELYLFYKPIFPKENRVKTKLIFQENCFEK